MVGGEHLRERISERLQHLNNQPRQRGYEVGCHLRGGGGIGKQSFGVGTLTGNWNEERFDNKFDTGAPLVPSEQAKMWKTTYGEAGADVVSAKPGSGSKAHGKVPGGQAGMTAVVDGRQRVFPGHQPETDPDAEKFASRAWRSEIQSAYGQPGDVSKPLRVFASGKAASQQAKAMSIVHKVKDKILQRSGGSFFGLRRSLRIMDDSGNGRLNSRELKEGLALYGIPLTDGEVNVVFAHFDRDNSGEVTLNEFVRGVSGEMNERRLALVHKAYALLDKNGDGIVRLDDIEQLYDVDQHPDVKSGKMTERDVLRKFMEPWDANGDDMVSIEEFVDYYTDISAEISSDNYFELMMRNTWHISGGVGSCANTSCRRVLVIYTNGRQSVEEIKNDLGIGPKDTDKMLENLAAQGITDVSRIELTK